MTKEQALAILSSPTAINSSKELLLEAMKVLLNSGLATPTEQQDD